MLRRMFTVKFAYARSVSGSGDTLFDAAIWGRYPVVKVSVWTTQWRRTRIIVFDGYHVCLAVHLLRNSIHQMPTAGRIANIYQLTLRVRRRKVAFLIHQTLVLTRQRGRAMWQRGLDDQCERAIPQRFAGKFFNLTKLLWDLSSISEIGNWIYFGASKDRGGLESAAERLTYASGGVVLTRRVFF